jgi:integrase
MASINRSHQPDCAGGGCECPWRLDYRPQGTSGPRKRLEFPTKKAAEQYLSDTKVRASRGEYLDPSKIPTFKKVAEEWLSEKLGRHPSTVEGWRVHIRHVSALDSLRLDKINVAKIEKVRDELATRLGPKTIAKVLTTCAAIFKLAIRRGYAVSNPAAIAERPRTQVTEITADAAVAESESGLRVVRADEVLSPAQIKKLLENSEPGLFRTLFATVAATGLRPEEAYALKWSDFSLSQGKLFVRRSLSWARGADEKGRVRPKFFEPKTRSGYRTLPLPPGLVSTLKVWKLQCPQSEHDLVFCRPDGQPLHRSNVLRQGLYPALAKAELPSANVKTLRHSYASGLKLSGSPITEVQHRLGHSDPSVTLRVYSHWYGDKDSGAVDRFASEFIPDADASEQASFRNSGKSGQKVGTEKVHKQRLNSVVLLSTRK